MAENIWSHHEEWYPIPDGFVESSWKNDACPSYRSADGRCMIWLHDDATLLDVYGIVTGYPRFVVDFHPTTEDIYGENDEAEGFLSTTVATWENVLQLVTILLKES